MKYWVDRLNKPYNKMQECKTKLAELENKVQDDIKSVIDSGKKGVDYEEYKIKDIVDIIYGGNKFNDNIGIYPLYAGGIKPSKYIQDTNIDKNTIIISRSGNNAGYINKTTCKSYIASYGFYLNIKKNISNELLYYTLKLNQDKIYNLSNASVKPNLNRENLYDLNIKIPTEKQMKKLKLQELFEEIDELNEMIPQQEKIYNDCLEELHKTLNPENDISEEEAEEEDEEMAEPNEDEPIIVTYKEKQYIVEDNTMYSIKKDGTKNKPVGYWNDGKVKKIAKQEAIEV
jgi:restriction endonuclease S subunit